jgi:hypothetical protein
MHTHTKDPLDPTQTQREPRPLRDALRYGGLAAVAILLLLTVIDLPTVPYDIDHDLASSASLEYFATRGIQFGTQLIQNVGPLGWIHYSGVYAGFLQDQKVAFGLLRAIALTALLLWAATRFGTRIASALWLLSLVAFVPLYPVGEASEVDFLLFEQWTYLCVYLAGLALLALPPRRRFPLIAVLPLFLLAFLALVKHTLLLTAGLVVGSVVLERLRRREFGTAVAFALVFAGFVLLVWMLAGQHPAHLLQYGLGVFSFTSGYNEVMALPANDRATALGFAVLGGLAGLILMRAASRTQSPSKSLIDAFFLFVLFKHGFVRGDVQHVAIFFHASAFLALLFGLAWERPGDASRRALLGAPNTSLAVVSAGLLALCSVALFTTITDAAYRPARLVMLWERNLAWIVAPGRRSAELADALASRKQQFRLPKMQERVGRARIDFFGYKPGWLLLNDMEYAPRPMPITFAATNEFLLRRNEAFYRDPKRAPRFVLCELMTIDDRLVPLDDGLALGAILDNYHPLQFGVPRITAATPARRTQAPEPRPASGTPAADEIPDDLLLLMERNAPSRMREHAERVPLDAREIGFGEALPLEHFDDRWLWLEVQVRPSLLGRLRSLLLRPARVEIVLDVAGRDRPEVRRYGTSMGAAGFLISPLIENSQDLFDAYATDPAKQTLERVRSVRFEVDPKQRSFFDPRIATRVYRGTPPGILVGAGGEGNAAGRSR